MRLFPSHERTAATGRTKTGPVERWGPFRKYLDADIIRPTCDYPVLSTAFVVPSNSNSASLRVAREWSIGAVAAGASARRVYVSSVQ